MQYLSNINQKEFNDRVKQSLENKKEKTKMLEQILKDQEMKECSFKPQLMSHRQNRKLDQFLMDQFMYEQHKKEKAKERKAQLKQEKETKYRKVP